MHIRTHDLDEAIHAVSEVYCPHQLHLDRRATTLDTRLSVWDARTFSVVQLAYGAHVEVDAGKCTDLLLLMRCTAGDGTVWQGRNQSTWRLDSTIPVSADRFTRYDFGPGFDQTTFLPRMTALEACCTSLVGRPLEDPVRFDLVPFTPGFERTWTGILSLIGALPGTLPEPAGRSLEQFVLLSLLDGHPHNYSRWMHGEKAVSRPTLLVDRAEAFVEERTHDLSLTVSDIATAVGVSLRALQSAFQAHRGTTPTAYLRAIRLKQARECLMHAAAGDTVTDVALAHGFFHLGRFALLYKQHFGEAPSDTLRARHRRTDR